MTSERAAGFTLIEVLVALAIIAFALVAVFGQLSQSASAAARLREKTLAHWVAIDRLTELRLSGAFPGAGESSDETEMANTRWRYEIKISETDTEKLRRADVSVASASQPERPLITVTGFLPERKPTPLPVSGWFVLNPDGGLADQPPQDPQPDPVPDGAADSSEEDSGKPDDGSTGD
jgi:general secretion pathway protein I